MTIVSKTSAEGAPWPGAVLLALSTSTLALLISPAPQITSHYLTKAPQLTLQN